MRQAITDFIENKMQFDELEGYRIMTINLVYPFKDTILDEIAEINTRFHQIIKTITDWRIAEKKIEMILAVGEFGLIKDFYMKLASIKDVICSIHEIVYD